MVCGKEIAIGQETKDMPGREDMESSKIKRQKQCVDGVSSQGYVFAQT